MCLAVDSNFDSPQCGFLREPATSEVCLTHEMPRGSRRSVNCHPLVSQPVMMSSSATAAELEYKQGCRTVRFAEIFRGSAVSEGMPLDGGQA